MGNSERNCVHAAAERLMKIFLVRHAAPEPPIPGSPPSIDDERPLTGAGQRAAEELAKQLARHPITAVYSSPYRRALETVEPIALRFGLDVRVEPDLRERRLAPEPLAEADFLEALRRAKEDPDFALPGGESSKEVRTRAFDVFEKIRASSDGGVAVAGTHGGLISIVRWSLGMEFTIEEALAAPMPAVYILETPQEADWQLTVGPP